MYNIEFYLMHFDQEHIEQALEQLAKESDLFNYNVFLFWLLGLVVQQLLIWETSTRDTKVYLFCGLCDPFFLEFLISVYNSVYFLSTGVSKHWSHHIARLLGSQDNTTQEKWNSASGKNSTGLNISFRCQTSRNWNHCDAAGNLEELRTWTVGLRWTQGTVSLD